MDTALDPGVRVQALLVDLDGTLVDTTRAVESAWQRAAERLGVDLEAFVPLCAAFWLPKCWIRCCNGSARRTAAGSRTT
jgi:hypothetical protein